MSATIARLVEQAMHAARVEGADAADMLWQRVLDKEPRHTQALTNLGLHALERGDADQALRRLEAARLTAPTDLFVLMSLADARGRSGDADGEFEALQWVLAVEPRFAPALFLKANWFERRGEAAAACDTYRLALRAERPAADWPGQMRIDAEHAAGFVERHTLARQRRFEEAVEALQPGVGSDAVVARWREAAAIHAGRSRAYVSESRKLHVPRLPAIPYFEPEAFAGLERLEAATDAVRDEARQLLNADNAEFRPCVALRPDEAVAQWQALNHSMRWSAYHLWRDGEPVDEHLERCPVTAELLRNAGMCRLAGIAPNAFFSVLAPMTHIPPHTGDSNARVVVHLPLFVPQRCRLRVGFEEREWQTGRAIVFDDTLQHEAFNDSNEPQIMLVFDLWNPLLDIPDRHIAAALADAGCEFRNTQ